MYVHPKLERDIASLDSLEIMRHCRGIHSFGRDPSKSNGPGNVNRASEYYQQEAPFAGRLSPDSFRHSNWRDRREQTMRAIASTDASLAVLNRFCECGNRAYVVRELTGERQYRVLGNYCKSRWCEPCARARGGVVARCLTEAMEGSQCRFVTLTVRSVNESLKVLIDRLLVAFRKLQRSKFWIARVTGGAAFLEVKRSKNGERWHPHLHLVVQGKFLPAKILSQLWHAITGDSYIVDVRLVRDRASAVNYITKYCTKPIDSTVYKSQERLIEAIEAMHGRRTINTFGGWRGIRMRPTGTIDEYEVVARLEDLLDRCAGGSPHALMIYAALRRLPDVDYHERGPPNPDILIL